MCVSLNNGFKFSSCRSYTSFVKFIPRYLLDLDFVIVSGNFSFLIYSTCWLFESRKAIGQCMEILYLDILLNYPEFPTDGIVTYA